MLGHLAWERETGSERGRQHKVGVGGWDSELHWANGDGSQVLPKGGLQGQEGLLSTVVSWPAAPEMGSAGALVQGASPPSLWRVSRELATVQAGTALTVIQWLMPQIDVFLSLVSWSPLVTAAALQEAHLFGELI